MNSVIVRRETITPQLRNDILSRDNYTCRYCGSKKEPFHLDHVYPVVKGGETSKNNLVTSCVRCNSRKHSSIGMWPKPVGYFDEQPKTINISILTVFLLSLGVALLGMEFSTNLVDSVIIKWTSLFGTLFCLISLGRVATGR